MGDPGIIPPGKVSGAPSQYGGSVSGQAAAYASIATDQPGTSQGREQRRFTMPNDETLDLNLFQISARSWQRWHTDRPVVMVPYQSSIVPVLGGQQLPGAGAPIYYNPGRRIPTATPTNGTAQVSKGCGVVYLPRAGWWNLYWDASNSSSQLQLMIVDASDPAVASRYMFEAGVHDVSQLTPAAGSADFTVTVADQVVMNANRNRQGFYIALTSTATNAVRLGFNAAAVNNGGVRIGIAQFPMSFAMNGDSCFKGEIHAIRDATAVADCTISLTEWE